MRQNLDPNGFLHEHQSIHTCEWEKYEWFANKNTRVWLTLLPYRNDTLPGLLRGSCRCFTIWYHSYFAHSLQTFLPRQRYLAVRQEFSDVSALTINKAASIDTLVVVWRHMRLCWSRYLEFGRICWIGNVKGGKWHSSLLIMQTSS